MLFLLNMKQLSCNPIMKARKQNLVLAILIWLCGLTFNRKVNYNENEFRKIIYAWRLFTMHYFDTLASESCPSNH